MANCNVVFLCIWAGDAKRACDLVSSRLRGVEIREFPHRKLRVGTFGERIRLLRGFRGQAVIFYFPVLAEFKHKRILNCLHFLHRCQQTVLCDESGRWESIGSIGFLRSASGVVLSILLDLKTICFWWIYLQLCLRRKGAPIALDRGHLEIAYLIPNPANIGSGGGAISHIRGFLGGVKAAGIACRVFSGTALAQDVFRNEVIDTVDRSCFFWGAAMLSYNFVFARGVQERIAQHTPRLLYQRHVPFSIAGALLSKRLKVPLILEYNGSEVWVADHWDPNPLRRWIKLCEDVTLRYAARIVVVSDVLREQLLERGIEADRVRVNPNAVDPDFFYPGRGGASGRMELEAKPDEVLIGFVGSFSLWHGIEVLQQAIVKLLSSASPLRLRFVLMGDGLLHAEMRAALAAYVSTGDVIFTGLLPREKVAEYLDACDILVSPHIPMPDGSRFFGSPTKLFEYMAMGKGIIASRLDQLAEILEHNQTAWLVTPGDVDELAEAILRLAQDSEKRAALGSAARRVVVEQHSWSHNVACALADLAPKREQHFDQEVAETCGSLTLPRATGKSG
jgi:glycosyltransferase involved in cell wall biosynthesis